MFSQVCVCLSQVCGAGGTPSQFWVGGIPRPRSGWGVPHSRSGGTPFQVWMVGGYPIPGLDGGGTPTMTGWGLPTMTDRVPPMTGWGTPPTSIVITCYVAGSMPLAFMQEEFLV